MAGPLYIKGHADPSLLTAHLYEMIRQLRAEGIQRVEDGIVVERHAHDPALDLELASVEFVGAAREIKRATEAVEAGDLEEMIVTNRGRITVLRRVAKDYYLMLVLGPAALLGRGRYELRKAAHELSGEFA